MRVRAAIAILLAAALPLAAQEAEAPAGGALLVDTPQDQSAAPILTIDPQLLFLHSAWGQRVNTSVNAEGERIEAENERLAAQFSREEQELTDLRRSLPADEFRRRADDFDKRVVEIRRERDGLLRTLDARVESERSAFFRAALPILAQLMKERGAQVVLDQNAIFVAAQAVDVTDDLVARLDREIGAGPATPPGPDAGDAAPGDAPGPDAGSDTSPTTAPVPPEKPTPPAQ
jgi:Skp family chaperone for outer membrane proteins